MKSLRVVMATLLGMVGVAASVWGQSLPTIKSLAQSRNVVESGKELELFVFAEGEGLLHYQWERNGLKIPDATSRSYTISSAKAAVDTGWYRVAVSNAAGSVLSRVIFVNVAIENPQFTVLPAESPVALIPADLGPITAIALGEFHILALRKDGTVRAWGQPGATELEVPDGLNDVVAVATCKGASFALRADGTVVGWGVSFAGSPDPGDWSDVVQLSAGQSHLLMLRSDYRVRAWGWDGVGQTQVPENMGKVIGVGASYNSSFAWSEDQQAYGWGSDAFAQIADARPFLSGRKVISVVGGEDFCLALVSLFDQDQMVGWGRSYSHVEQHPLVSGEKAVAVKAGLYSGVALLDNESAVIWGFVGGEGPEIPRSPISHAQLIEACEFTAVVVSSGPEEGAAAIRVQPQSHTVLPGQLVVLTCIAESPAATYQWHRNGAAVLGATGSSYSFVPSGVGNEGHFTCRVSVGSERAFSAGANLRLQAGAPAARFSNFSVRSRLKEGEESVALGFILRRVSEVASEALLIRAAGPALRQFGLTQVAADPRLELIDRGAIRESNDDWVDDIGTANATRAAGAFPFSPGAKDAALVARNLEAGSYAVRVHNGEEGGPLVALAEVYRAGGASPEDQVGLDLINLSVRGGVGVGEDTLVLGFVIEGSVSKTVLITGIGKPLAVFGITRPVADPVLRLYQGNKLLLQNDNGEVSDTGLLFSQIAGRLGSLAHGEATSSGIVLTLAPGAYTVHLSDKTGGTGVALLEVFAVE